VNDLFILPGHADTVLFVATDAGVYSTTNGGADWARLGGNMPFIPVFDLEQNPVRKELMAATYARGIWTFPMDSVFALQNNVTVSVSGQIKTESGAGVTNVSISGQTTVANGLFSIPGVPGCQDFSLAPYRDDNPLNGVSTYDLVLISKHILGIEPLNSPYKIIAADANKSNSVTTFDIVTIRKLILGIDAVFPNNTSWRFIPSDFVFPNPANPFQTFFPEIQTVPLQTLPVNGVDFTAVKVGDVNGNVNPVKGILAEERTSGDWPLAVQDVDCEGGKKVVAEFQAGMANVAGAQFSVQFDAEKLVFEKIEPLLPGLDLENFGTNRAANGVLSVCFEFPEVRKDLTTFKKLSNLSTPLFRVIFKAKTIGNLNGSLRLSEHPTPSLAYEPDGKVLKPVLEMKGALSESLASVRAWPNPFGKEGVWLQVPIHREASFFLQIFDSQGKFLFQKRLPSTTEAFFSSELFPTPGIYFYKIEGMKNQVGKLVYAP
jgi:hypothetical protein